MTESAYGDPIDTQEASLAGNPFMEGEEGDKAIGSIFPLLHPTDDHVFDVQFHVQFADTIKNAAFSSDVPTTIPAKTIEDARAALKRLLEKADQWGQFPIEDPDLG
jgi:hypothetical protein